MMRATIVLIVSFFVSNVAHPGFAALSVNNEQSNTKTQSSLDVSKEFGTMLNAVKSDNFTAAEKVLEQIATQSRSNGWAYYPLGRFVNETPDDSDYLAHLNHWIEKEPSNPLLLLLRSKYYYTHGWVVRGVLYVSKTPKPQMQSFVEFEQKALEDIQQSITLDPTPTSELLLLRILQCIGNQHEKKIAFYKARARFPDFYPLYRQYLTQLQPKWGGSLDEMTDFTFKTIALVPQNSPLKALPIALLHDLIDTSLSCYDVDIKESDRQSCFKPIGSIIDGDAMQTALTEAFQLYRRTDPAFYQEDVLHRELDYEPFLGSGFLYILYMADSIIGDDNYEILYLRAQADALSGGRELTVANYERCLNAIPKAVFISDSSRQIFIAYVQKRLEEARKLPLRPPSSTSQ